MRITQDIKAEGTLTGKKYRSKIDPAGLPHVMNALSTLYSNPHVAVLREYAANARDSHIEAGNPAPIEITLPTDLNPTLVVTDHGIGLDQDALFHTFADYGTSTKRGDEEPGVEGEAILGDLQIGGLGFGSKSAFAIASQLTVTAVKDGRLLTILFAQDTRGPESTVLVDAATDQGNGVSVQIPIADVQAVRDAAETVFLGWPMGSVLVDGTEPQCLFDSGVAIGDTAHVVVREPGDPVLQVEMGGPLYPAPAELVASLKHRAEKEDRPDIAALLGLKVIESYWFGIPQWGEGALVFRAPLGAVEFTPSRESLLHSGATVDYLWDHLTTLGDQAHQQLAARLDEADSLTAAAQMLGVRENLLLRGVAGTGSKPQWRGQEVHEVMELPFRWARYEGDKSAYDVNLRMWVGSYHRTRVVTGVGDEATWQRIKRHVPRFWRGNPDVSQLLFTDSTAGSKEWLSWGPGTGSLTVEEFIAKAKTVKVASAPKATRAALSYRTWTVGAREIDHTKRPVSQLAEHAGRIAYIPHSQWMVLPALSAVLDPLTDLVIAPSKTQSVDALRKRLPHAEDALGLLTGYLEGLPPQELGSLIAEQMWSYPRTVEPFLAPHRHLLRHAGAAHLLDSYAEAVESRKAAGDTRQALSRYAATHTEFCDVHAPDLEFWDREWPLIFKACRYVYGHGIEHVARQAIDYLNLAADRAATGGILADQAA